MEGLSHRCIALLTPFCVYIVTRLMTIPTYNLSTFPSIIFFPFRIATSVSVPVRGAQPADVWSVAAVDGTRIAGGGRSLAWLSAVAGG